MQISRRYSANMFCIWFTWPIS